MKNRTANTKLVGEKRKMSIKEFVIACDGITAKSQSEHNIINFARAALKTQSAIRKFLNNTEKVKTFNLPDGFYYTIKKFEYGYHLGSAGYDDKFTSKKSMLEWIDDDLKELLLATINENYWEVV